MTSPRIILASSSPRRQELLTSLGVRFEIRKPAVPERRLPGETPTALARRLARAKALAVALREPGALVIGADTIVVLDGAVLGKPASTAHAARMLGALSGRTHQVQTAVAVAAPRGPGRPARVRGFVSRSTVLFAALGTEEIRRYVATGEPMDKAGAYAIQGRGAAFVRGVRGSVTNVIGLPLAELRELLRDLGVRDRRS